MPARDRSPDDLRASVPPAGLQQLRPALSWATDCDWLRLRSPKPAGPSRELARARTWTGSGSEVELASRASPASATSNSVGRVPLRKCRKRKFLRGWGVGECRVIVVGGFTSPAVWPREAPLWDLFNLAVPAQSGSRPRTLACGLWYLVIWLFPRVLVEILGVSCLSPGVRPLRLPSVSVDPRHGQHEQRARCAGPAGRPQDTPKGQLRGLQGWRQAQDPDGQPRRRRPLSLWGNQGNGEWDNLIPLLTVEVY